MTDASDQGPFSSLPFPAQKSIAVKKLAPVPPEFAGQGVLVGRMTSPFTETDLANRFGGGEFLLSYTEPGHRNPALEFRLVVDGEPLELEIARHMPSAKRRKHRGDEDDAGDGMPEWAGMILQELRRSRQPARDPMMGMLQLLIQAKAAGLLGGNDTSNTYRQAFDDAKSILAESQAPPTLEAAVAGAIPEFLEVMRARGSMVHRANPSPAPRALPPLAARQARAVLGNGLPAAAPAAGGPRVEPTTAPAATGPLATAHKWAIRAAAELLRAQEKDQDGQPDDPSFTASWMERYCPAALIRQLHGLLPSQVIDLVMQQLDPLAVALTKGKTHLDRGYVSQVVMQLLESDGTASAGDEAHGFAAAYGGGDDDPDDPDDDPDELEGDEVNEDDDDTPDDERNAAPVTPITAAA